MKTRSHARAADKRNFSIALPVAMIEELKRIAEREDRSKNKQIERFLSAQITAWKKEQKPETEQPPQTTPMLTALPNSKRKTNGKAK